MSNQQKLAVIFSCIRGNGGITGPTDVEADIDRLLAHPDTVSEDIFDNLMALPLKLFYPDDLGTWDEYEQSLYDCIAGQFGVTTPMPDWFSSGLDIRNVLGIG